MTGFTPALRATAAAASSEACGVAIMLAWPILHVLNAKSIDVTGAALQVLLLATAVRIVVTLEAPVFDAHLIAGPPTVFFALVQSTVRNDVLGRVLAADEVGSLALVPAVGPLDGLQHDRFGPLRKEVAHHADARRPQLVRLKVDHRRRRLSGGPVVGVRSADHGKDESNVGDGEADHPRVMIPIIFYNLVQHLVAGAADRLLRDDRPPRASGRPR